MAYRAHNARSSATVSLLIATGAFVAVAVIGYLVYLAFAGSAPTVSQATSTASDNNTAYAILKPATVPSKIAECSQPLSYQSDGNPSPIQCPDGYLNKAAWNALAALEPTVMKLGYTPTQAQVESAICTDGNAANADSTSAILAPLETSAYRLASLYYGWSFSINPTAILAGSC